MSVAPETLQHATDHKRQSVDATPAFFSSTSVASEYDVDEVAIVDEEAIKGLEEDEGGPSEDDVVKALEEKTTPWTSIFVAGMCGFVQTFQYSVFFSSLWPYLQLMDSAATETFFGFIIGCYSLGQVMTAPTFGYWSNKIKKVRSPLYVGFSCMIVGNLIYLTLEFLPSHQRFAMLFGRFITGCGSGNMSLLRAYASTASVAKDRARAIAFITGPIAFGMTVGPAFQLLFTPIGYPGWHVAFGFHLTMYNAPAFFAICMNLAGMLIIRCLFKEVYNGIVEKDATTGKTGLPPYDKIAVALCCMTRFMQMGITTSLETIGSPFAMMMYAWTRAESVRYISISQVLFSSFSFGIYLCYIGCNLSKYMNFRLSTMISIVLMMIFHFVTFSWWFIPGNVQVFNGQDNSTTIEQVGCDESRFSWCSGLSPINPWLFYTARALFMGLAFPTMNITMTTLFSRIIGPRRQGTLQGYFEISGGVARMAGPILISTIYMAIGPRWVWALQIVLIGFTLSLWGVFYDRMVPLKIEKGTEKNGKL